MRMLARVLAMLCFVPSLVLAQKACKKGIPCGGGCIAANKTCHVGAPAAPEPTAAGTTRTALPDTAGIKVWVNGKSHVYHCPGSRWYGATANGSYMTENAAKAAGNRAAYGKACGG